MEMGIDKKKKKRKVRGQGNRKEWRKMKSEKKTEYEKNKIRNKGNERKGAKKKGMYRKSFL